MMRTLQTCRIPIAGRGAEGHAWLQAGAGRGTVPFEPLSALKTVFE